MNVSLAPASARDLDFCFDVTETVMRSYVEQTWGEWNSASERGKYKARFSPARYRLVEVDGERAGIVEVEHREDHLRLATLYLLPPFQSQGIGADVLHRVIAEAGGNPLRLRVLAVNVRAQAFYARHGFRVTEKTAERVHMERP